MDPAIFVINLDRAAARLAAVAAEIRRFGWTFERVAAIDARAIDAAALAALAPDPWSRYQARSITPGEICCLASHRKAWTRLLETGCAWAIVLEDDAVFGDLVPDALRVFGGQNAFDLVKLEGITTKAHKNRGVPILEGPPPVYLMETVSAGAAAYCVSAAGARKLLRITSAMNRETDFFIRQYGRTDLVVGEFRPFPASQDRTQSFIGAGRERDVRPDAWARVVRTGVRLRESLARRRRFRVLSGGRPAAFVTMAGSSTATVGEEV